MQLFKKLDKKRMSSFKVKLDRNHSCFDGYKIGAEFTITKKSGFTKKAWWLNLHFIWYTLTVHYVRFKNKG